MGKKKQRRDSISVSAKTYDRLRAYCDAQGISLAALIETVTADIGGGEVMSEWKKLQPLTTADAGLRSGCLTCGPQPTVLAMNACIAVGFGDAGVTMDGKTVWSEAEADDEDEDSYWSAERAEQAALADPDHDWRIYYHGPLSESEYQRQGVGQWLLISKGMGVA